MIRIRRGEKPPSLVANAEAWRDRLLEFIRRGEPVPDALAKSYNQDDVKRELQQNADGKCMYCESHVGHVAYEHIEHYKPKARDKFPDLTFEWTNLGLACPICNLNKGELFNSDHPYVNPYNDVPSEHFVAAGPFILPIPGNRRAELTELEIGLNRKELVDRRQERLESLRRLIRTRNLEPVPALREALSEEIELFIAASREYSFVALQHARLCVPAPP